MKWTNIDFKPHGILHTLKSIYVFKFFFFHFRSLSELDSLHLTGEAGDKIRQVTERATLFRITSNAMINVSAIFALTPNKDVKILQLDVWFQRF